VATIIMGQIAVMAEIMDTQETITTMRIILAKDTVNDPDSTTSSRRAIDSALTAGDIATPWTGVLIEKGTSWPKLSKQDLPPQVNNLLILPLIAGTKPPIIRDPASITNSQKTDREDLLKRGRSGTRTPFFIQA
jgi:hypothetical protein